MNKKLQGIAYLLDLNRRHSKIFSSPGMQLARQKYRAEHPTEISADKCMDGRLHLPVMTETTLGIIQPMRNVAGKFDLGWIAYQQEMQKWVNYSIKHGRHCLKLITYHYDRHDKHRGCRGFGYDVEAAIKFTADLKKQYDKAFGKKVLYAMQLGIDTFYDALILHGTKGQVVDLSTIEDTSINALQRLIATLYPDMPLQIQMDLLPLVAGNIKHIAEVKASNRPISEVEHSEWVLAVGRGFDWLHEINMSFIVGPFHPNLSEPIGTAAKIMLDNMKSGRINGKRVVLLASAQYREAAGSEPELAACKARFLTDFAFEQVKKDAPELAKKMQILTGVVDMTTRKMKVLKRVG